MKTVVLLNPSAHTHTHTHRDIYVPPPAACMATILGYLQMFPVPTVDPRHVNTSPIPDENLLCIVKTIPLFQILVINLHIVNTHTLSTYITQGWILGGFKILRPSSKRLMYWYTYFRYQVGLAPSTPQL